MNGIESSIYFMLAMMFVGMPTAVIGGIAWECRKRTRLEGVLPDEESLGMDPAVEVDPHKVR